MGLRPSNLGSRGRNQPLKRILRLLATSPVVSSKRLLCLRLVTPRLHPTSFLLRRRCKGSGCELMHSGFRANCSKKFLLLFWLGKVSIFYMIQVKEERWKVLGQIKIVWVFSGKSMKVLTIWQKDNKSLRHRFADKIWSLANRCGRRRRVADQLLIL